uniref:Uncharacterized protein n=1 Tax=Meloidogyne hapla TaxID=6305 RepID=A0A1I8BQP1_MELHA
MFRKLKSKTGDNSARNTRQRIEEEGDVQIVSVRRTLPGESQTANIDNEPIQTTGPKHTGLSFNEGEGDDLVGFKLKKHGSQGHRSAIETNEKILRKQKMLAARAEKLKWMDDDIVKREDKSDRIEEEETFKGEIEKLASRSEDIICVNSMFEKHSLLLLMEFLMPKQFMKQERNERFSDSFYSAKKLLQSEEDARREEQANFLSLEQGSSGEDDNFNKTKNGNQRRRRQKNIKKAAKEEISDAENEVDELQRWEREQIMKGVSSNKVRKFLFKLSKESERKVDEQN